MLQFYDHRSFLKYNLLKLVTQVTTGNIELLAKVIRPIVTIMVLG